MFDARIAIEETQPDLTDKEIQEMNEFHDSMDREWEDRCEMADLISDLSKDVQGFRYRFDWQNMPMDQLEALYNEWIERHARHMLDYDADHERAELDLIEEQWAREEVERQLSTPDEWDDLYSENEW